MLDNNIDEVITNDYEAERLIRSLKFDMEERDRNIEICEQMIREYKMKQEEINMMYKNRIDNKKYQLKSYFESEYINSENKRNTATQKSYVFPSAKLVYKKPKKELVKQEGLLEFLQENGFNEYINNKTIVEPKWGEFKKNLKIVDNQIVLKDTGEIIEDIVVIEKKPDSFDIKFN